MHVTKRIAIAIVVLLSVLWCENVLAENFVDDFSTDTTGEYTVTHTWTDGGVGQFLYDSVDARVQVLTGDDVGLMFSHDVPVLNTGIFSIDFLPTQKYPGGGILYLRLVQDENNYYEIKNSDGYGPKQIKKVVSGAIVASVLFQSEYTQNNNYHITITFSPDSTTVEAFGDVLTLSGNSDSISVSSFEVQLRQQDAYYDNIFYTDSGANVPPVANDDSATTDEDTAVTIDVVANDTDTDGTVDPTSVAISILPSHGTADNNLDGTITYTPDTGFTGPDTFTYTVNDEDNALSNEANVTVTVAANVPPVANDDSATTDEDTAVTIDVVANDTDTDGTVDPTSVAISILPSHGTADNNLDGTITYTPDTGYLGADSLTYTVDDNDGASSNVATVEITISDSTSLFSDDFSTDTTGEYTVTHTWTDGGVGQFLYDSVDARVQVLTGDDVGLMFSHDVPVLNTGIFSIDFLPTQKYPGGGILYLRLVQDENNYYEIKNSDGYGPKQIKKVVSGAIVASVLFQSEYTQNNNYHITITFSPDSTTVEAFGDVLTLSGNSDSISVSTFEVRLRQQDAYYDNIFYTDSGANVPPVANDDSATTDEDTAVTIDVVANDIDTDGTIDPTSVAISILPSHGTADNNLDGTITYTPDTGFTGPDTFTYTVNDDDGATSNEATVTVTVAANMPPVANDDSATTDEDTAVTIDVVSNDTDTDGTVDPTSVAISILPSHGTADNNLDGTITYTPDTGYLGADSLTYTVDDNDGASSNVATVEITISDSTSLFSDDFSTDTTGEYTVTHTWTDGGVGQFLYDSVDARVQVLTGDDVGLMFSHDVTVLNTGIFSIDFLPTQKYPGGGILYLRLVQDENNYYEIKNSDGYGPKQIKKVVSGAIVASVLFQSEYTQNNNYHITITFSPDSTTVEAFGDVLTLSGNSDSISVSTFEVRLGQQDAYYDNIFYTDSGANVPPVANDDSATTDEDTAVTIDVVANDTDTDGTVDPTSVAISILPSHGTADNNLDGTITYTPDTGFTGPDTFTYTVNDDDGATSNEANVTVTVAANVPPVANDDSATTDEDTAVTVNVVVNDTDIDGTVDPISVAISILPSHGTADNNLDGTITYTPDTGFTGPDTFTYTVNDDDGATSNEANVTVTVAANVPPVANDDSATTDEDTAVTVNVVVNDTDIDGTVDPISVAISILPSHGTADNNLDGTITYTPDTGFTGPDTFTYTVNDDDGATSNEANVTVTVAANVPPVANDDSATTDEDTAVTVNVVVNDTDIDGTVDPTTITVITDALSGGTTVNGDGTIIYTPDTGYVGTDTFTYTVNDDDGATSNEATVLINVIGNPLFYDDFSSDTTGNYTITHTLTNGGFGSFIYDGSGQRVQVLTGDDVGLQFSHDMPSRDKGIFSVDFLPIQKYPNGGIMRFRLVQDQDNYYEITNTDGYGAQEVKKVVNGVTVDSYSFTAEYAQNNNYHIEFYFTPAGSVINAFGETAILDSNGESILVSSFEIEARQQDAYFDNIEFTDELFTKIYQPDNYYLTDENNFTVKAISNADASHQSLRFVVDVDTPDEYLIDDNSSAPFEVDFLGLVTGEHTVDIYIVDDGSGLEVQGPKTHDQKHHVATGGDYYVGMGDSITFGKHDDDPSDDTSNDGRNIGGGYIPVLNDFLTTDLAKPHYIANEGVPGAQSVDGRNTVQDILNRHPQSECFLILYGTNDAGALPVVPSGETLNPGEDGYDGSFKDNMQQIINAINGSSTEACIAKVPVQLADCSTCPWYENPSEGARNEIVRGYNRVIYELFNETGNQISVVPPDFYTYYLNHYEQEYADWLHPNGLGYRSMADLWRWELTR